MGDGLGNGAKDGYQTKKWKYKKRSTSSRSWKFENVHCFQKMKTRNEKIENISSNQTDPKIHYVMPIIKYRLKFGQGSPNLTNKGMSIGGIQPNFLETPHPNKKKIPTIQCFNWPNTLVDIKITWAIK